MKVTNKALAQARMIDPEMTVDALQQMARRAAIFTHPHGNRRYQQWLFQVDRGTLTAVGQLLPGEEDTYRRHSKPKAKAKFKANPQCQVCHGSGYLTFYDICENCGGDGCPRCERGEVTKRYKCPECKKNQGAKR